MHDIQPGCSRTRWTVFNIGCISEWTPNAEFHEPYILFPQIRIFVGSSINPLISRTQLFNYWFTSPNYFSSTLHSFFFSVHHSQIRSVIIWSKRKKNGNVASWFRDVMLLLVSSKFYHYWAMQGSWTNLRHGDLSIFCSAAINDIHSHGLVSLLCAFPNAEWQCYGLRLLYISVTLNPIYI